MRKTHKDYKKEYNDLKRKQKGLESRIRERTKEMVKKQPSVMMNTSTVSEFFNRVVDKIKLEYQTQQFLRIIKVIEDYNEKKSNIKQLKMFEDNERKNN
jgi:hypothetical protein